MSKTVTTSSNRRWRVVLVSLAILLVLVIVASAAFQSRRAIRPLAPHATPDEVTSVVSRVVSGEAGRIIEPRSRFYEQSAKLGSRWWLDSRQGAVARQQNTARELRRSLEQWRDATQGMSGEVKTRLVELRVPQLVVDETVAGAERGIATVQPLFELRFAQLDDLDRLFQLLASAPWTSTAGRVTFGSPQDQSTFDALIVSIDQTEMKIEALSDQLKSQRSR